MLQSVKHVGFRALEPYAFQSCKKLTEIRINGKLDSIGEHCFSASGLQNVILEKDIHIGPAAFKKCYDLQSIDLTKCKSVGDEAFARCKSLQVPLQQLQGMTDSILFGDNAFKYSGTIMPKTKEFSAEEPKGKHYVFKFIKMGICYGDYYDSTKPDNGETMISTESAKRMLTDYLQQRIPPDRLKNTLSKNTFKIYLRMYDATKAKNKQ